MFEIKEIITDQSFNGILDDVKKPRWIGGIYTHTIYVVQLVHNGTRAVLTFNYPWIVCDPEFVVRAVVEALLGKEDRGLPKDVFRVELRFV